ncbi:MAG: SusC/RagA family TonB-linked outer membrane protein [Ginsengibacter sp.]
MKKLSSFPFIFVTTMFLLFSFSSWAQNRTIIGVVKGDKTNAPLEGATVTLRNSKTNTITKSDGKFSLNVPQGKVSIVVTFVGHEAKTVSVAADQSSVTVELSESSNQLSDVVIIGVQAQVRRKSTSAISTVTAKDIENMPAPSVDQLLQGRVAGLNVQIGDAAPGVAPTVVVRGNSKVNTRIGYAEEAQRLALSGPLYVIDGMPTNPEDISNSNATGTNFLAGLNVNDIESVDVQKDAAATAAWGSRGANGVIYITTKKGTSPTPQFRINGYGGLVVKPQLLKTMTGSAERQMKLDLLNIYGSAANLASIPRVLTDRFNPAYNNATDWQGLFYGNGSIKNFDADISAATSAMNYRVGLNYYDEQGIIKAFGFQRYSFRGNFNFKINPKLNSQLVVGLSKADRQRGIKYNNSDDNTPVSGYNQPASFYKVTGFDSLSYLGQFDKLRNKNLSDYYNVAFNLNYSILPQLKYTFQGSANITLSNRDYFQPSNIDAVVGLDPDEVQPSYAESNKSSFSSYFMNNALTYSKILDVANGHTHNFVFTASQQFSSDVINSNYASGYNVPSNDIQVVQGVPQTDISAGSNYASSSMLSFLGQLQYDYDGKYLLYGSYRGDASSRFGKNSKWGYFPAIGLGWIVSDEKFFDKAKKVVNELKIRGSYGVSGSQSPDYYAPFNSYTLSGTYEGSPVIQPDYYNGLTKNNLTWARLYQKNVGIDASLFNNKILFSVDAYDKLSKGDFYDFQLPFFTGYGSVNFNANDLWVSNKGLDVTINARNILAKKSEFQWGVQITLSHNKNILAKLPNNNRTFVVDDWRGVSRIYSVGQPIYTMFQLKYAGVYNNEDEIPFNQITGKKITYFKGNHTVVPGDPIWVDVNKIGDVWPDEDNGAQYGDRIPTGDPNPKFTGGWVNTFSYKNFSLSILSIFTWKRDVVNTYFEEQVMNIAGGYDNSPDKFANSRLPDLSGLNYWTPQKAKADPNYKADFPSLNPYIDGFYKFIPISSMFNEDGSYLKIKDITLNYMIPETFIKKAKIKGARVYAEMENVATFKNSTMPNPELVDQLGIYSGGAYPTPKKFTLGIEIRF